MERFRLAAAILAGLSAASADAGEVFVGVAAHDLGISVGRRYEPGVDLVAGGRTEPLARVFGAEVRGHLFASVDTAGGIDFAALGATLRWALGGRFYIAPGIGVALADGPGDKLQRTDDRLYLGSHVLFEPELSLGARLSRRLAVEIAYVHLSHGQLAGEQNPGLDTLGARLVLRLGGSAR